MILKHFVGQPFLYQHMQAAKDRLSRYPSVYLSVLRIMYCNSPFRTRIVDAHTDIVIEGFPRSANSFAAAAFRFAQDRPVRIATHVHSPAQVIAGCRRALPTLVLIREPREAVVSWKALRLQGTGNENGRRIPISSGIYSYISFYECLQPYRDHFVLARFEDIVQDFGRVIEAVNTKFGTEFDVFRHTEENVAQLFRSGGMHLSPSKEREQIKARILAEIAAASNAGAMKRAQALFEQMTGSTDLLPCPLSETEP